VCSLLLCQADRATVATVSETKGLKKRNGVKNCSFTFEKPSAVRASLVHRVVVSQPAH
jgi:hypothetical protein